ncbi:MAG: hypothetical protein V3V20_04910 [Algisphaera sp.]
MQQVKVFASHEYLGLENDVNAWIKENDVKVVSIQSNIAHPAQEGETGDLLITVTYEK